MKILSLRNIIPFVLMLTVVAIGVSCGDKEEPPTDPTCETEGLTYTNFAAGLLNSNCATSGCHNADASDNGTFQMHNYEAAFAAVGFGRIVGAINWEDGFSNMPKGGEQLSDCNIEKMEAWIASGAAE